VLRLPPYTELYITIPQKANKNQTFLGLSITFFVTYCNITGFAGLVQKEGECPVYIRAISRVIHLHEKTRRNS
jgi:hypothetical protein